MLEVWLGALAATDLAHQLRFSRWGYAAVNTTHILGLALLIGAICTLNLRLLGVWSGSERQELVRVLVPVAALGLLIASMAGLLLFITRAVDYGSLAIVQIKLALVAAGTISALWAHLRFGLWLERMDLYQARRAALVSLVCWLGALVLGRLIAFVG